MKKNNLLVDSGYHHLVLCEVTSHGSMATISIFFVLMHVFHKHNCQFLSTKKTFKNTIADDCNKKTDFWNILPHVRHYLLIQTINGGEKNSKWKIFLKLLHKNR